MHPDSSHGISDGFRRLATAAALASTFAYAIVFCVTPAAINEIARVFGVGEDKLGLIPMAFMCGFFPSVLAGGKYADRTGKLPLTALGVLLMGVGTLIFTCVPSFNLALAAAVVMGLGGGLAEGMPVAVLADLYGGPRRTAMMNWSQVVFGVGAIGGPALVARLLRTGQNWHIAYMLGVVVCAITTMLALAAAGLRQERLTPAARDSSSGMGSVLSDPLIVMLSVGIMLYVGAEGCPANWAARFFLRDLAASPALAAASVSLFWAGITLGRVTTTALSRWLDDITLITWALGLSIVFQVLFLIGNTPLFGGITVFLLGFFLGPTWPTIVSRASAAHPECSGAVMGIVVAAGGVGAAVFPPLVGRIARHAGMRAALGTGLALVLSDFAIFALLMARARRERHLQAEASGVDAQMPSEEPAGVSGS